MLPAATAVPVPDGISEEGGRERDDAGDHGASLRHRGRPGRTRQVALVHAARWWLGQKLVQLIKARGGTVIGLVSTQAKAAIAQRIGAADVVVSTGGGFVERALTSPVERGCTPCSTVAGRPPSARRWACCVGTARC